MRDVLDSIVVKQTRIHQKEFEQKMSVKRLIDFEDIFKLKEILKPKLPFNMQEPLKFVDTFIRSSKFVEPNLVSTRDTLEAIYNFRNKNRKKIQSSLQQ
jgi:hypothetical protein